MEIYVVRHGITELNKKKILNGEIDEPLAPEGIDQARSAIDLLPPTINYLYVSPMLRTRQTAEIINSKLQRPIVLHSGITEVQMGRIAGNSWEGMDQGMELKKKHRAIQYDYTPHGGESSQDVKKRVLAFLKEVNTMHGNREALIVTHGGIVRMLHFLEKGVPLENDVEHIMPIVYDVDKILARAQGAES